MLLVTVLRTDKRLQKACLRNIKRSAHDKAGSQSGSFILPVSKGHDDNFELNRELEERSILLSLGGAASIMLRGL